MEWWALIGLFLAGLMLLSLLRVPIGYALLTVNLIMAVYLFGFEAGIRRVVLSASSSVTTFVLVPVPLFILMGELLVRSGVADSALTVVDRSLGRVRARLPILATASGAVLGVLSGSTLANTAVLGRSLLPRMLRSGYSSTLGMGSILASGGLAMIIPPSALAVVWAATAGVPVGALLIAGIVPGFLMALNYVLVIVIWSRVFGGAPETESYERLSLTERMRDIAVHVIPLGVIVFLVLGLIFLGVATPSESAALGCVGAAVLAVIKMRGGVPVLGEALLSTAKITSALFLILLASGVYSQLMSFSGATSGLVNWMTSLPLGPLGILLLMQLTVLMLGLFLEQISIMLVTLPLFMPIVATYGWNPIWFGILMLINLQMAGTTPPFGLNLFVLKGVAPASVRMSDVYRSAVPFVFADVLSMALVIAFPILALWLPALMFR